MLVVADFQRAAHLTHDAVGHREPKAEALADRLGGEEGLEHLIQMFAGNTAAVVAHAELPAVTVELTEDAQASLRALGHGIQRVVQQIDQHLLEADGVAADRGLGRYLAEHLDLLAANARREQLQGLLQHLGQAQTLVQPGRALASEGLQVAGQRRHAFEQAFDMPEAFAHLAVAAAVEQQAQAGELHAQCGQRLVDLVGEGGGHLPESGHACRMHQFVLGGVQLTGALVHQALQLAAAALFDAAGLAALRKVEQQKGQRHPHASRGQAIAAHAGDHHLWVVQQVQGPVVFRQRQALPEVFAAAVRAIHQTSLAALGELLHAAARQRLQRLFGIAPGIDQAAAHLVAQRAQIAEAPGRAVGEDDDIQRVGDQQDARLADPVALHLFQLELDHQHAEHLAVGILHRAGEEVAGNAGGDADGEIAAAVVPHRIAEIRAEGVVVANEAAPVAPVAGGDGLAVAVEQVQHRGAGCVVLLFQALVELAAQRAVARFGEQRLDVAVQRQ